eukprot:5006248-Pyramimonas_sp.AAC.1
MITGIGATWKLPRGASAAAIGPIRHWRYWSSAKFVTIQACGEQAPGKEAQMHWGVIRRTF